MLAFMDDLLDPQDAQTIAKKIEQSEFATNLMHRIRDCMRRMRLGAPNLTDKGAGLDPNTVSEYLDNTLPDADVPDFEKICLESDVHLAELASCHQVLAMVLGEPAEVDPSSRQRMYQLPEVLEAKTKQKAAHPPKLPSPPIGDGHPRDQLETRPKPEVPEYLRTRRGAAWWRRGLIGAAAVLLAALALLFLTRQFERGSWLASRLGIDKPVPTSVPGPSDQPGAPAAQTERSPAETIPAAGTSPATLPSDEAGAKALDRKEPLSSSKPLGTPGTLPLDPGQPPAPGDKPPTPTMEPPAKVEAAGVSNSQQSNPLRLPTGESAAATAGAKAEPGTIPMAKSDVASLSKPVFVPESKAASGPGRADSASKVVPPVPFEPPMLPPEQVGKCVPRGGILLRLRGEQAVAELVPHEGPVFSQDRLLSLPAFRPAVLLVGDVRMELIDGARVDLQPVDASGAPGIAIDFGRVLLRSEGQEKCRLRIQIGNRIGTVVFGGVDSAIAVQVGRVRSPGTDPETESLPRTAELFATGGRIGWQDKDDRDGLELSAGLRLTLNDRPLEAVAVQQFPKWISSDAASALDQLAAATIEREVRGRESPEQVRARPVNLVLHELAEHKRGEVRWLAIRCLGYLGDFSAMVQGISDPERRHEWQDHYVEPLREAVSRSPETATAVRAAMQKLHGAEWSALYELLWKYPDDRLSPEQAAELIRMLDHEVLAVRVLAFWGNLYRITGKKLLYYRPEETAAHRAPAVAKWKERLKLGFSSLPQPGKDRSEAGQDESPLRTKPATKKTGADPPEAG
jgi:hypothetical protein